MSIVLALILYCEPLCGQTNILVYTGICSSMGFLNLDLLFTSIYSSSSSCLKSKFFYMFIWGYEHKGCGDCYKVNIGGYKPDLVSRDLVFLSWLLLYVSLCRWSTLTKYIFFNKRELVLVVCCAHLVSSSYVCFVLAGAGHIQRSNCVSNLLCDVHYPHNRC